MAAESAQLNTPEPHKPKHPAYRVWLNVAPEVREQRIQIALDRILNDEKASDIAQDMGISRAALNMAFLEYAEQPWQKAQIARGLSRLQKSQEDRKAALEASRAATTKLESAAAALMLASARDDEKAAQWELERLLSRLFGPKTHVTVEQVGDLGDKLRRSRERVIEAEPVADAQHAAVLPAQSEQVTEKGST